MISTQLPSLSNMCATSMVYRFWTNQDIYENRLKEDHWQLLERKVENDIKKLAISLPKLIQSLVLPLVKPAGRHYFSCLNIWFQKIGTNEEWLKKGMLSSCLTLYAVGIINQRKTAQKLLRNQTLPDVIAFRLACINFLEEEVLRLWPSVMQYFLNKIVAQYRPTVINDFFGTPSHFNPGFISEPSEVIFWIGYCLSIEQGVQLQEVPHFSQFPNNIWHVNALCWARVSGCIPYFEYLLNCSSACVYLSHEYEIRDLIHYSQNLLISFFYHFSSLDAERKTKLFREFPGKILSFFLQWPLSLLLLEDTEKMCVLLDQLHLLELMFVNILKILHGKQAQGKAISDVYATTHLRQIWISFWQVCPDAVKLSTMTAFDVERDLDHFIALAPEWMKCDLSNFKKDLLHLFASNGEAFLNFLTEENLGKAIEVVVSKFITEKKMNLQLLRDNWPSTIVTRPNWLVGFIDRFYRRFKKFLVGERIYLRSEMKLFHFPVFKIVTARKFINYIENFLLSNNLYDTKMHYL